jgi:outer membrane protein OmpA-like peptidoglycan-associated protein
LNAQEDLYPYIKPVSVEKAPILDSDKDGVIDENDKCPYTPKGEVVNSVGCKNEITIVLLNNKKEKNAIVVSTKNASVTVDKPNQFVKIYSAKQAPSKPKEISKDEISKMFPYVSEKNESKSLSYVLYFKDIDKLHSSSQDRIQEIVDEINTIENAVITVNGYTDTVGSKELNDKIAKKRVEYIVKLLKEHNVKYLKMELNSFGETNLMIPTDDNVNEPLNRRVEIFVH